MIDLNAEHTFYIVRKRSGNDSDKVVHICHSSVLEAVKLLAQYRTDNPSRNYILCMEVNI